MFMCERCGSGYNANYIGVESCPRCLLLDRVESPLSFKMFRISDKGAMPEAQVMPEAPVGDSQPDQVRSAR